MSFKQLIFWLLFRFEYFYIVYVSVYVKLLKRYLEKNTSYNTQVAFWVIYRFLKQKLKKPWKKFKYICKMIFKNKNVFLLSFIGGVMIANILFPDQPIRKPYWDDDDLD